VSPLSTTGSSDETFGAPQFSAREVEVLTLICRGRTNVEIAAELFLSINSVKTYVRTAYRKIGLDRRAQVIVWAQAAGYATGETPWPVKARAVPSGRRSWAPGWSAGRDEGWRSEALASLPVPRPQLATEMLTELGLPVGVDLLGLAELGLTTLDAALAGGRPEPLTDFVTHAADRLSALRAPVINPRQLGTAVHDVIARHGRGATTEAVDRVVRAALSPLRDGSAAPAGGPRATLGELARVYLAHALAGEADLATAVVVDAVRGGMDIGDVLVDVLEAAQHEIGRLWQVGQVTVDQEHVCTAITQASMTALYPYLFSGREAATDVGLEAGRRLVSVHARGSLHQVGLRMVTDLLEHQGWDTTYLGSDVRPEELPDRLVEHGATVLALSASMADHVEVVRRMIDAVRADERTRGVRIAVGGRSFVVSPALAAAVGADGWAPDARAAVALCNRLAAATHAPG
jgi:methanogenic corrinoid protein MtbC1/DNA-binding CsgD family transcriptional regulator